MPVVGFEYLYEVSNYGYVRNQITQRHIKGMTDRDGYIHVGLRKDKKLRTKKVHRLVLSAFVGCCPAGMEACHNDGVKANNRLDNLRWDTHRNNQIKDGGARAIIGKGELNPSSTLSEHKVLQIKYLGKSGLTHEAIGCIVGANRRNVSRIIQGERWGHIGLSENLSDEAIDRLIEDINMDEFHFIIKHGRARLA